MSGQRIFGVRMPSFEQIPASGHNHALCRVCAYARVPGSGDGDGAAGGGGGVAGWC